VRDKTKHADYMRAYRKRRYAADPAYRVQVLANNKGTRTRLKVETFEQYGGCGCACCGEETFEFLTLDHINNDGAAKRRESGNKVGWVYYQHLKKLGWPEGYQVLCFNCNSAKGAYGTCPHTW
jgi:hypothetical protein